MVYVTFLGNQFVKKKKENFGGTGLSVCGITRTGGAWVAYHCQSSLGSLNRLQIGLFPVGGRRLTLAKAFFRL